jgi:hypothetical protein
MNWRFAVVDTKTNLNHWNARREAYWHDVRDRVSRPEAYTNGLLCPECGGMLYDTGQVESVSPTKLRVKCKACKFKGARYE